MQKKVSIIGYIYKKVYDPITCNLIHSFRNHANEKEEGKNYRELQLNKFVWLLWYS